MSVSHETPQGVSYGALFLSHIFGMMGSNISLSMFSLRGVVFVLVAVTAVILGVLFSFPHPAKDYARVQINGASLIAELASDAESRMRGLGGRKNIAENAGMLFLFETPDYYGFWMKGMEFPIDIFWLRNGAVADLEEGILPHPRVSDVFLPLYKPDVPADMVLETRAGFAKQYGIKIGDRVSITLRGRPFGPPFRGGTFSDISSSISEAITPIEPGARYFIGTLATKPTRGSDFKIQRLLLKNTAYRKYLITYRSGGLTIHGVMNVPVENPPPGGFPIIILNHGLIHPSVYFSGRGSKREQDFFARNGYVTIHPDYRGHADSSPNPETHHDFYVGYTEDVSALVDALKDLKPKLMDVNRIGMWGHSMGGGIAARAMVLRSDIRAFVLFASISADVEDNFYELPSEEIAWLGKTYGIGKPAREIYKKISPLTYFDLVSAPVQLHHGIADTKVPVRFSETMYQTLVRLGKKAEFYTYAGEKHEFADAWQLAAERALQFFDRYVKNAR